jgi:hypothetical protein
MDHLIYDFVLRRQLRKTANEVARVGREAQRSKRSTQELEDRIERLTLACTATWELVRERVGVSDDELLDRIRDVDLRDGVADGKLRPGNPECPDCERVNNARRSQCMYCGAELPRRGFS